MQTIRYRYYALLLKFEKKKQVFKETKQFYCLINKRKKN
jgi:hypothetical protein